MSLFLADKNGFVQDLATARGWSDVTLTLKDFISSQGTELAKLISLGTTDNPASVASEVERILPSIKNKEVKHTLSGLRTGLQKCKDIAIISQ